MATALRKKQHCVKYCDKSHHYRVRDGQIPGKCPPPSQPRKGNASPVISPRAGTDGGTFRTCWCERSCYPPCFVQLRHEDLPHLHSSGAAFSGARPDVCARPKCTDRSFPPCGKALCPHIVALIQPYGVPPNSTRVGSYLKLRFSFTSFEQKYSLDRSTLVFEVSLIQEQVFSGMTKSPAVILGAEGRFDIHMPQSVRSII